jgi:glutaredoxin
VESFLRLCRKIDFLKSRIFIMGNLSSKSKAAVTLYVVPGCPLCERARAWLERHRVEYAERDVAGDFGALRAMYRLTGQRYVPVFEVGGRALVRPGEDELAKLLL